jgi:hypothetical protein
MDLLPFLAPLLVLGVGAWTLRTMREAGAWLRADGIESGASERDDGVFVHEERRVVLTVLEPVRFVARVALEIEVAIPPGEAKARLRAPDVQRLRAAMHGLARIRRFSLTNETLTMHVEVKRSTAPARQVIEHACALAAAIESASIHDVEGEGSSHGSPVAVRALGR